MKNWKKFLSVLLSVALMLALAVPALADGETGVLTLVASGESGSTVRVSGTAAEDVKAAVVVQVLSSEGAVLGMESLSVSDGKFSGTVRCSGTAASVRAADYDGGAWKTATVSYPVYEEDDEPIVVIPSKPQETTVVTPGGAPGALPTEVKVSGSTASISGMDAKEAQKVILAAAMGQTDEFSIDLSGAKGVESVALPAEMTQLLATALKTAPAVGSIALKLPTGTVELDTKALSGAAAAAQDGLTLTLKTEGVKLTSAQRLALSGADCQLSLEISLRSGKTELHDLGGGTATVRVPFTLKAGQKPSEIETFYVAGDGTTEKLASHVVGGELELPLTHCSTYVAVHNPHAVEECAEDATCPLAAFEDVVSGEWYHDGLHYCVANGMMGGYGDGRMGPDDTVTRGQFVLMLWRMEGCPDAGDTTGFTDVPAGEQAKAVAWAQREKMVEGYGDGLFGTDDPILREQLAKILLGYAVSKGRDVSIGEETNILSYDDAFDVDDWAIPAMQWACGAGILQGYDNRLMPQDTATRAEAATMLQRFCA